MSFLNDLNTAAARQEIKRKSNKLARKARQKSVKFNNAQIQQRKHLYNSIRTKHK